MKFIIDNEVFKRVPDLCVGVVIAKRVSNVYENAAISTLLIEQINKEKEILKTKEVKQLNNIKLYSLAMEKFGINRSKYKSSVEALLERIRRNDDILSVNGIVNLCNYISIKYKVSVGVQDTDLLKGSLKLRFSNSNDCDNNKNHLQNDRLDEGEIVYATGENVLVRRWIWRTSTIGRIGSNATNYIFLIDGFEKNQDSVANACKELSSLIEKYYNVDTRSELANCYNASIELNNISNQEKKIENTIKIMLKGVENHTELFSIKEKLRKAYEEERPLRVKLGLDPSAPDIHLGHSVVLRKIRQLQELGHQAIIIIGDYTGRIGDPTGKSKTRKQLTEDEVRENALTYQKQIFKILDPSKTIVKYNSEWFENMNFQDVISLASKCTVARMMERDDFENRYKNHLPLSVHEFFYPLMQAYDSVAIGADIELGGTDQTFNILMGRNIQKSYGQEPQITLFMPLLEGIDGVEKMSKSLGNYIGINEDPFVIFEKVMKIKDEMIIKYYNLCTDVHPDIIDTIQKSMEDGMNPRDIKLELAFEITKLYSSEIEAQYAKDKFIKIYQNKEIPDDIRVLTCTFNENCLETQLVNTIMNTGDFGSKSEIRRILKQGGIKWNNQKIIKFENLVIENENIINVGKKHMYKIIFV